MVLMLPGTRKVRLSIRKKSTSDWLKRGGGARNTGNATGGIGPEQIEHLTSERTVHEAGIAVVGPEVVIVPYGVMVCAAQEPLHLGGGTCVRVTMQETGPRSPIRFAQVDVVAEPEHEVRALVGDRVEDAVVGAVRFARTIVGRFIDVRATAHGHGEFRGIAPELPEGLGTHGEWLAHIHHASVHHRTVSVRGGRQELVQHEVHRVRTIVLAVLHRRAHHAIRTIQRPILHPRGAGALALHPDRRFEEIDVPGHGAVDADLRGKRGTEQERGEQIASHGSKSGAERYRLSRRSDRTRLSDALDGEFDPQMTQITQMNAKLNGPSRS